MTNSSFLKRTIFALFALSALLFVSCDDDFNFIGADIIDGDVHSDLVPTVVDVVAYDRATGAVQSNNMLQNQLGIYDNPIFGKTVSHFVTQIVMASENPTLYSPDVDSVYLYIPYHTERFDADTDGNSFYRWGDNYNNTIYGDTTATFKLEIFRNGYYLRDSDPSATDNVQRYYSDDRQIVDDQKMVSLKNLAEFKYEPKEVRIRANITHTDGTTETNKIIERKEPGLFEYLDPALMKEIFFSEANKGNLINNSVFKNYFRGLYFQVTQTGGAVMNIPRFSEGTITFKIHDYESKTNGTIVGPDTSKPKISKTITFNLKGNTINFFDTTPYDPYKTQINTADITNGDENLYLNGGPGAMSIINLNDTQLGDLHNLYVSSGNNLLINEANLVFHLDKAKAAQIAKDQVAQRIYLYDLKNSKPIIDYSLDGTKLLTDAKRDKYVYGGIMDTLDNGDVIYKMRLTNHVKNIIKGDSTNVRLGLVVTDNINIIANYRLKIPFTEGGTTPTEVKNIPYSSVQSPWGTILHGSSPAVPVDKRVKLEIYYSKPKE